MKREIYTESEVINLLQNKISFFDCFTEKETSVFYNMIGCAKPGDRLIVYWKDKDHEFENPDTLYCMSFPTTDHVDLGNLAVHVTEQYGEKGEQCEEFLIHIVDFANNEFIEKIEVRRL